MQRYVRLDWKVLWRLNSGNEIIIIIKQNIFRNIFDFLYTVKEWYSSRRYLLWCWRYVKNERCIGHRSHQVSSSSRIPKENTFWLVESRMSAPMFLHSVAIVISMWIFNFASIVVSGLNLNARLLFIYQVISLYRRNTISSRLRTDTGRKKKHWSN